MTEKFESESVSIKIYMCGEYQMAENTCRLFCIPNNLCVNIHKTDYIFRGGMESGFCVELINYPRYPETFEVLFDLANILANELMIACVQASYTITTPLKSYFYSRRDDLGRK